MAADRTRGPGADGDRDVGRGAASHARRDRGAIPRDHPRRGQAHPDRALLRRRSLQSTPRALSLSQTLGAVIDTLTRAGIPHMLAGSVASTYYGEPRTTQDVDVVVDPAAESDLDAFVNALDRERFYVGDHSEAFARREPFNVIDTVTGWKVDLIIRRDRAFSRTEFDRRRRAEIAGIPVFIATPEDTILTKLEWARLSQSERQLRDVQSVARAIGESLDREYLSRWASELGVEDQLDQVVG
ncbi:MAG: nucleotidyltransferase family protein [Actinobacteria bacterium]|nr:nucleotidyltransferase family protein [Actinomycetota bacterium]